MRVDVAEWAECAAGPLEQARPTFGRLATPFARLESEKPAAARAVGVQAPAAEGVVRGLPVAWLRVAGRPDVVPVGKRERERPRRSPEVRRVLPGRFSIAPV